MTLFFNKCSQMADGGMGGGGFGSGV